MSSTNCGCCSGLTILTPQDINNRWGLRRINYRIGTHSDFLASMLSSLSSSNYPELDQLTTREPNDFSIGLLDAASSLMDLLTFYQERIANESYLATATERRSLYELARLTGYTPRSGAAANAYLVFTLDDSSSAPDRVVVKIGTKVQSVPGPDEKAQTFETTEEIEARPEWNALRPLEHELQHIEQGMTGLYLEGDNNLSPGDAILVVDEELQTSETGQNSNIQVTKANSSNKAGKKFDNLEMEGKKKAPGASANLSADAWDFRILRTVEVLRDENLTITHVTWAEGLGKGPTGPSAQSRVYVLRQRASIFGHNAPNPKLFPQLNGGNEWKDFEMENDRIDLDAYYPKIVSGGWIVLAANNPSPARPSLLGFTELYKLKSVTSPSRSDFTLSAKITRIIPETTKNLTEFKRRQTTVFAQSEPLQPTKKRPIEDDSVPGTMDTPSSILIEPSSADSSLANDFDNRRWMEVEGNSHSDHAPINELVQVSEIETIQRKGDSVTRIQFATELSNTYDREKFRINANVAKSSHGETVDEILGSGDASKPFQQFRLRQPPLTFLHSAGVTGAESTLQVIVNGLSWREVPTLYGQDSKAHVFTARTDDQGTTLEFGLNASRLPTGNFNVHAHYRKGIGLDGDVRAGQLTTLATRPLGVRSVRNPQDAFDGADPDMDSEIRERIPVPLLTLGRVVSFDDYEGFSLSFAGVAKASAISGWDGRSRWVLISVAGPKGTEVSADTCSQLAKALRDYGDPFAEIRVKSFKLVSFAITVQIAYDHDANPKDVRKAVNQALLNRFSFDIMGFGQSVSLSEIVASIQETPGVIGVTMQSFYSLDEGGGSPALNKRLDAASPTTDGKGGFTQAELLVFDKKSVQASVIT